MSSVLYLILNFSGAAAIGAFVARWLADRWVERANLRWKHEYDEKLERLKAEQDVQRALAAQAFAAASGGYMAAQERRLKAIDTLWSVVLRIRSDLVTKVLVWDMLPPSVFQTLRRDKVQELLPALTVSELVVNVLKGQLESKELDEQRPFMGERLWAYIAGYRALASRLNVAFVESFEKSGELPAPRKIFALDQRNPLETVDSLLSADEIALVKSQQMQGISLVFNLLENKMLREIEALISGAPAARAGSAESARLIEALQQTRIAAELSLR